jgi:hypothetical protein
MVRIYDYIGDCGLGAEGCLGMPLGKMDRRDRVQYVEPAQDQ